ncbi:unnamed protein product, partial [Brenthis ino]
MDIRAEKLAKARKKLKDHQEKKTVISQKCEGSVQIDQTTLLQQSLNDNTKTTTDNVNEERHLTVNGNRDLYSNQDKNKSDVRSDINVTEILISNRTNLEMQISELNGKLANLEYLHELEINNHNTAKQKIIALQSEVTDLTNNYSITLQEASIKDDTIKQLNTLNQSLKDENNNLSEQLEFTKSMLTSKEFENAQLQNQIFTYQNQLDSLQLQIQQLTNDSPINIRQDSNILEETDALLQKIPGLEQKIEALQKERDHIQSHYEHYVHELNEQLRSEMIKNENLAKDLQNLYNRESSLVDQISDMEIRLQNYDIKNKADMCKQEVELEIQKEHQEVKEQLEETNKKYSQLKMQYTESIEKIQALLQEKDSMSCNENICNHDNVDITKLTADITSDKLAAQRATEQNKKLKLDVEGLEQVVIKMGKDKLELTEKWTHEKQLNKGLALKLAEVEENFKTIHNQLKAKDDEMIRLQNEYRIVEQKHEKALHELDQIKSSSNVTHNHELPSEESHNNHFDNNIEHTETSQMLLQPVPTEIKINSTDAMRIQKEDAMVKLQERFLNIMDEVANLSDEKHRLEHIILQLQNETDTICEYVALYQQQRSLLKKREEERSNQLKIFQAECDKLKRHLEELSDLLLRLAADEQLASFLKEESKHNDLARVKELLQKLQNCSLINPKFKNLHLNVFYPCNCCSGQLIDI